MIGTPFIVFTGGEPTHPLIWPTIRDICAKHNDQAFMMYTNGTLLDDNKVQELLELGNLSPVISIEGWKEDSPLSVQSRTSGTPARCPEDASPAADTFM